jgi:hypothetical protein
VLIIIILAVVLALIASITLYARTDYDLFDQIAFIVSFGRNRRR